MTTNLKNFINPKRKNQLMNKKAFVFRIVYFIIFVLAVILLIYLIKNKWDVGAAFGDILGLFPSRAQ
jgi:cell division septal protein FtsQ